jgi:hypothetical protein
VRAAAAGGGLNQSALSWSSLPLHSLYMCNMSSWCLRSSSVVRRSSRRRSIYSSDSVFYFILKVCYCTYIVIVPVHYGMALVFCWQNLAFKENFLHSGPSSPKPRGSKVASPSQAASFSPLRSYRLASRRSLAGDTCFF